MNGFSNFKNKSIRAAISSFLSYLGMFSLLIMLASSCDIEKINLDYTQIFIANSSTNQLIITNVDILQYTAGMSTTISEMRSANTNTRNQGFNTFITDTSRFPWENTNTAVVTVSTNYITNTAVPVSVSVRTNTNTYPEIVTTNDSGINRTVITVTNIVTNTNTNNPTITNIIYITTSVVNNFIRIADITNVSTAISIEPEFSRDFIRRDCDTPIIIRIDNNYTNTTAELYQRGELHKKYAFALMEPAACGRVYRFSMPTR